MITQQQYDELKSERDALAAQAKALKDLAEFWINQAKPYQPSEQEYKTWLALGYGSNAMRSTPQQHLAEIRAEAVLRFGAQNCIDYTLVTEYAAKVRKGAE